ncbi:MAG: hypothetical protein JNJ44_10975 [Zoogloeaceae bacterium]|nr:hypothetical protein [Zoogloeaceae bacterium]
MKRSFAALTSALLIGIAAPAFADRDDNIPTRVDQMERRIDQGVRSGALTGREARELQGELEMIKRRAAAMHGNDGRIDRHERERLHDQLDRLSYRIRVEKHDDDMRGHGPGGGWGPGGGYHDDRREPIPARIESLERRIDRGIQSGALTRHEARDLQRELMDIRRREDQMRMDGRLSPDERARMHAALDRLERRVRAEKHDEDTRRW